MQETSLNITVKSSDRHKTVTEPTVAKALIFYEIFCSDEHFTFKELKCIYPQNTIYDQGMHTFNAFNNTLAAIDGRKFRKPFISKSLLAINKTIKKIK